MRSNLEDSPPASPPPPELSWARQAAALAGFLAASWMVSLLGSLPIRLHGGGWYAAAEKAPWTPPGWMFSAVWLTLYAAMGVAAWLVWRQRSFPAAPRSGCMRSAGTEPGMATGVFRPVPPAGSCGPLAGASGSRGARTYGDADGTAFWPISTVAGVLMLPNVSWIVFSGSLNLYAALNN